MSGIHASRFMTLVEREFREYRNSLFWTPLITAVVLAIFMLGSVVLVNRVSMIGDTVLEAMMREGNNNVNITVSIGEDGEDGAKEVTVVEVADIEGVPAPPPSPPQPRYEVVAPGEVTEEQWNFSREWRFNPEPREDRSAGDDEDGGINAMSGRELNVGLSVLHGLMLLVLLVTSVNYLLGSLYDDRKDRSILFWRSMPVSELQVVLSKLVTALILAPMIYIAISLLLQLAYVLLMMLLVWRMDQDPFAVVTENIDFVALMLDPISGWLMTALLIAPLYAWLLCASALARRSPFLMAVTPVVAVVVAEAVFFRTEIVGDAVSRHVPHLSDGSAVGFYLFGPDWVSVDLLSVAAGLLFALAAITAAVWLRQHRWELN